MLENIKKKLNNALKEGIQITENISTQFSRVHSPTFDTTNDPELGIPPEINITAGSELLQKYEQAWKDTFEANKVNERVAADITEIIDRLQQRMKARQVNVNDLLACLSGLPAIEANLKASLDKFDEIEKLGYDAEEKIAELNNVCQLLDMQEKIMQRELEARQKEMAALEAEQQRQAAEQRKRIRQDEERIRRLQEERHAAFDEAFQGDMEAYKQTGAVSKVNLRNARVLTLEEIVLDDDGTDDSLEDFLNDGDEDKHLP